jgi:pyrroloquinoline quinone biosynthesis protein B
MVQAPGKKPVLLNASPDVRAQLAQWSAAQESHKVRQSPIAAVVLTNADLDHCLGLLVLREGGAPALYGTEAVLEAVEQGLGVITALSAYGPTIVHTLVCGETRAVQDREGVDSGITIEPFAVASKVPPYAARRGLGKDRGERGGDTVGLLVSCEGGGTLAYVPGVRDLDDELAAQLHRADAILLDGTFWTHDELTAQKITTRDAYQMGHAPLQPDAHGSGSLEFFRRFSGSARRGYVHINNSNPIVRADSPERAQVERAGIEVVQDGTEWWVERR